MSTRARKKGEAQTTHDRAPDEAKFHGKNASSKWGTRLLALLAVLGALVGTAIWRLKPRAKKIDLGNIPLTPRLLHDHCEKQIGPPRVIEVTSDVYVAIGFDLANTILVRTAEGHVVVDVAMNFPNAKKMRDALEAQAGKAPIHTIIYTHSHVDHVGGAGAWAENGTKIWATDELMPHFFKQYGAFRKAESLRGSRQFGAHVPLSELPCSGIGAKADVVGTMTSMSFKVPTHTFKDRASFKVGGLTFELVEAHGETHDQMFVWIPEKSTLLPGDNYYESYPNLYTIRGTSPRPIRKWVQSLDDMRRLEPEFLVPSHTQPVIGRDQVARKLTDYRDGIQWVYTHTVRGANAGKTVDELVEEVKLPAHLRNQSALAELYGQIDWSVRAIYTNELGWFDGKADDLYPLPLAEQSGRLINLLGGTSKVLDLANEAVKTRDFKWALYMLKLLKQGAKGAAEVDWQVVLELEIRSLRGLGEEVYNTNGRGYLFQVARELAGEVEYGSPTVQQALADALPIDMIFEVMINRIRPAYAIDTHETLLFVIGGRNYYVTVRYGLAEVSCDEPLYGTPEPIGTLTAPENIFRQIALKRTSPAVEVAKGTVTVEGDAIAFIRAVNMFESGA